MNAYGHPPNNSSHQQIINFIMLKHRIGDNKKKKYIANNTFKKHISNSTFEKVTFKQHTKNPTENITF